MIDILAHTLDSVENWEVPYQVDKSLLASRVTDAESALSLGKYLDSIGLLLELDLVVWVVLERDERTSRLGGHFRMDVLV